MPEEKNSCTILLKHVFTARKWNVLRLIAAVEDYSKHMPNVQKCQRVSRMKNKVVTAWKVDFDGLPLSWEQEDCYDFKKFTIDFNAIRGDLKEFRGQWRIKSLSANRTEVEVEVHVRLGIPQVELMIGDVVAEKIRKNFKAMFQVFDEMLSMHQYRKIADRKRSKIRGFAVMCHPYSYEHLIQYLKFFDKNFKLPSPEFLSKVFELTPSYASYELEKFVSKTGKQTSGHFIVCPIIPDMLAVDINAVVRKVIEGCKVAEKLGLGILALGGFTSIAGETNNKSIRKYVNIPVTTGNTFTVALALQGVRKAAKLLGVNLAESSVAIIGGAGDIGGGCAKILAEEVREVIITSRSDKNLVDAERTLSYIGKAKIKTNRDNRAAVKNADIVIAAASSTRAIVQGQDFKHGAIVCDIGYPKNIAETAGERNDLLVFSGGICHLPDEFNFGFDVGLPSTRTMYGCYAEAIILDLEEKYENFSEGRGNITKEKVGIISELAAKHGFEVAPFFWGHKLLSEKDLSEIRKNRQQALTKHNG